MPKCLLPLILLALLIAVLPLTPAAQGFPEPSIRNPSWSLDFTYETPRPISIQTPTGGTRWFWYMPYKVVNNTGEDRLFIPDFTIMNDRGEIVQAGQNVPTQVYSKVSEQLNNPLLESPAQVIGRLLQGQDFARESVAIWPAWNQDVDEFYVFVGGVRGETQTVPHPLTGEPVLTRRTLMLRFRTPGTPPTPQDEPVIFDEQREVMR